MDISLQQNNYVNEKARVSHTPVSAVIVVAKLKTTCKELKCLRLLILQSKDRVASTCLFLAHYLWL